MVTAEATTNTWATMAMLAQITLASPAAGWRTAVCASCQGTNFTADRSKGRPKLISGPLLSTTRRPNMRPPKVACRGDDSRNANVMTTGRTKVKKTKMSQPPGVSMTTPDSRPGETGQRSEDNPAEHDGRVEHSRQEPSLQVADTTVSHSGYSHR